MIKIDRRYILATSQIILSLIGIWGLLVYSTWYLILLSLMVFFLMRVVGAVITYHRIHSHRTHTMHPVVEFICTAFGFYGYLISPVEFAALHTHHHKYNEKDGDPHPSTLGWKRMFPVFWEKSGRSAGDIRTVVRLRRNKITNFFYKYFWFLVPLPLLLLLISVPVFLFGFVIPSALSMWSSSYSTLNHDANGAKNMGFVFGILSGGEHMHKWHHEHPYDTSGEGWLNVIINLIAKRE